MNDIDKSLLGKVKNLFRGNREQHFEDGVESCFSRDLIQMVERYGSEVIEIISLLIKSSDGKTKELPPSVVSEALRWIGQIEDSVTYEVRLSLLLDCLENENKLIKDGAILGLSFLDDRRSIPHLKRARDKEDCIGLKKDMNQVIEQWNP